MIILAIAATAGAALVNGGFESGDTTGWTTTLSGGSAVASTAYAKSGTYSLALDSTGAGAWSSPNVDQTFAYGPGTEVNLSGYILQPAGSPITDASFGLFKIEFVNGTGGILEPASVSIGTSAAAPFFGAESGVVNAGSATDTWIFNETQAVAPAGTASIRFLALNVNQGVAPSPIYFDDIAVSVIPEPATVGLFGLGALGAWIIRRKNRAIES